MHAHQMTGYVYETKTGIVSLPDEVLQLVRSRQLVQKWASDDGASWPVPESGCGTCSSGPQKAQAASLVAKERKEIAIPLLHVNVS